MKDKIYVISISDDFAFPTDNPLLAKKTGEYARRCMERRLLQEIRAQKLIKTEITRLPDKRGATVKVSLMVYKEE